MNTYTATLKHDTGNYKLKVYAREESAARKMITEAENCPECAIIKLKEEVTMYKVVKIFRVSRRREVLRRYLTEAEAQRVVNSYPDSQRSMVVYCKQFSA